MPLPEIVVGPGEWLALVALGAVTAVDSASWLQFMVSRPLISATAAGWMMGDPVAGMLCGGALELMTMAYAPYGAARYPDVGPASVVSGAAFAAAGGAGLGPLMTALLAGWILSWLGSWTVHLQRRVNAHLVLKPSGLAGRLREFEWRHRLAIAVDALRGALLVAGFAVPTMILVGLSGAGFAGEGIAAYGVSAVILAIAAATGAGARSAAHGLRGWPYLLLGAAVSAMVLRFWVSA